MAHRIIRTEADRQAYVRFVQSCSLPRTFEDTPGADRTSEQNKLQWLWATEAAHQLDDCSPREVQCRWKLEYGVPILREDSQSFRDLYDASVKPLPYHMKLRMMEIISVTSEMKVRQMVRYLDEVQRECSQQGICLTDPDPELAAYQQRYRMKAAA